MESMAKQYLEQISRDLQDQRAALFVGAGFSRNADKVTSDVPDIPLWGDLKRKFQEKLGSTDESDPLVLAESVELVYDRNEMDRLLLDSLRDADYRPSPLYEKLLRLPWTDVFTTNYDTLLERAGEKLTEKTFQIITNKNDLIGSSGKTRLIKLHGSFPSQRPFIITAEDYRTYPQKFAPFVNTVQQSLLENTLCMIGFSGDDPNFNSWVGWIRDNLGEDNAPAIYLLNFKPVSDARKQWLHRRKIIAIDLSELFPEYKEDPYALYEKVLDQLWEQYSSSRETGQFWPIQSLYQGNGLMSLKDALPILRKNRENCPKVLTLSARNREELDMVLSDAERVLGAHCRQENPDPAEELYYLYEYNALHEKSMLTLFASERKLYAQVLARHTAEKSPEKCDILFTLLRTAREEGDIDGWNKQYEELCALNSRLTSEQKDRLQWENCLFRLSRYEFCMLKEGLRNWPVSPDRTLWALRKAGLCAEVGDYEQAENLLQEALQNLRHRLARQTRPDRYLLSLESPMMRLQSFIDQAACRGGWEEKPSKTDWTAAIFVDERHRARHKEYEVDWDELNRSFCSRMENKWVPFQTQQKKATFDFGVVQSSLHFGTDTERMEAFRFLRFREETGIPFQLGKTDGNVKAACGAAQRIALYYPEWAILTAVRAKANEDQLSAILPRSVLSVWTQEDTDKACDFYMGAVQRTEEKLLGVKQFWDSTFASRTATVLPMVLSELCCKCSEKTMPHLLGFLEKLYCSPQKMHYMQAKLLMKRLLRFYPKQLRSELLQTLLTFPLPDVERVRIDQDLPDPFNALETPSSGYDVSTETAYPEIEKLFGLLSTDKRTSALERLLHCGAHGLLTLEQKERLGKLIWNGGVPELPRDWFITVCLHLPIPQQENRLRVVCVKITENVIAQADGNMQMNRNSRVLQEMQNVLYFKADAFSPEQITAILTACAKDIAVVAKQMDREDDCYGRNEQAEAYIYRNLHALWLLTSFSKNWVPTEVDKTALADMLNRCGEVGLSHHGAKRHWSALLGWDTVTEKNLERVMHSADEQTAFYGYHVFAIAMENPEKSLLSEEELQTGMEVTAQQIAWGVPKRLASALKAASCAAERRPDLLTERCTELVLTGLAQLLDETCITSEDTMKMASEKGNIRNEAVCLAAKLDEKSSTEEGRETLERWRAVSCDPEEFAEIRTAR